MIRHRLCFRRTRSLFVLGLLLCWLPACNISDPIQGPQRETSVKLDASDTPRVETGADASPPPRDTVRPDAERPRDAADSTPIDTAQPDTSDRDAANPDTATRDTSGEDPDVGDTTIPDTTISDTKGGDTNVGDTEDGGPDANDTCVPSAETCDGSDDDCDGVVDEGCPCDYNGNASGVCGGVTRQSDGTCPEPADFESTEISCADNLDNDCDGDADDADADCNLRAGTACSADAQCRSRCVNSTCVHRIFVTSQTFDGDLGGLGGADQICDSAASAAGLSGNWKALLSTSSTSAASRLRLKGPIFAFGQRIADGKAQFWSANHANPIDRDEHNATVSGEVWTGTNEDGTSDEVGEFDGTGEYCNGWTTTAGATDGEVGDSTIASSRRWCAGADRKCNDTNHLYCIDGQ